MTIEYKNYERADSSEAALLLCKKCVYEILMF
nr:MAG TPA: hypothetical protein [Caudoviricetes sp.]DAV23369.1 MAG TPA: hypothetical protein [Bacteriophage sp.]